MKREGILVHIIGHARECVRYWLWNESNLRQVDKEVDIGQEILEELLVFWRGVDGVYFANRKVKREGSESLIRVVAERLTERHSLLVFGAGHVGYSIAVMGVIIGHKVILIDDRREFLERAAQADLGIECVLGDFEGIADNIRIDGNSVVVIVTRGHQSDEVVLRQVARSGAGYVGMIGSRRRVEGVFRRLREQGVSDLFLKKVRAPIGLDIGARTPQEIAVSVHAEIIEHFNGADSEGGCEVA